MSKTYDVNEIFYSLQGEGYYTGTPAVFLRLCRCNRHCDFCDTDFSASTPMTASEILERVTRYSSRHIVVTGGEPLLQLDSALLRVLKSAGFYVQIETNGSLPVPPEVDWVTCSPKEGPWRVDRIDELKIVYRGQDVEQTARLLQAPRHYLQPCSGLNTAETVRYILDHPQWKLSLQTHKLIDIQ